MSRYGGSFGFGGGMLDEQAAISDRRASFASQMAEMLARNPDLDPNQAMQMVDNAAGTDNTLRGVISRDAVQSQYAGRQRARRIDLFNAVQAYLKNNPDATPADAQQALMVFSGGQTDPEILKAFTTQIEADKKRRAQADQERQISATLQNRNALMSEADRLLMEAGDPIRAQDMFRKQFGDNPFGFNTSGYITEQRLGELSKARALDVYQNIAKIAGDTGDFQTALNMYGDSIPPHIRSAVADLVKKQDEAKGDKMRSALAQNLTSFIPNAASLGLDPQNGFTQYTMQVTGKTPAELSKMGIDISGLQNTFSAALQNERKRLGSNERGTLAQAWTGAFAPVAEKFLRNGDTPGLIKEIMSSAQRNQLTNVTEADAAAIVTDLQKIYSVQAENKFKDLNLNIGSALAKEKDDLVKASTLRAKDFFVSEASGKAMGLNSPMGQQFAVALGSTYDFTEPNNLAIAAQTMQAWAQKGSGDLGELKGMMDQNLNGRTIDAKVDSSRSRLEAQAGTFGQDTQISASDFESQFVKNLDKSIQEIEDNYNEIVSSADGTKGADGVGAAINDLQNFISQVQSFDSDATMELKARQQNTMWHASGEQIQPDLFPRLAQAKTAKLKAIVERAAKKIQELKTTYGAAADRQSRVNQVAPNVNAMKLPPSAQPPAAPAAPPSTASTTAGRFIDDAASGISQAFTSAMTPGPADQRSFRDISGYWLDRGGPAQGWFTEMSKEEATQADNIAKLMLDRGARSLIADTPQFLEMLDPKSPGFNPGKFLQAWDDVQKSNAAPRGTTGQ